MKTSAALLVPFSTRLEVCDVAAVGRDGWRVAVLVRLGAGTPDADLRCHGSGPLVDEDVTDTVAVAGHEVAGVG